MIQLRYDNLLKNLRRIRGPIGLDIGHNSIKMIQLAVESDKPVLLAAAQKNIVPCPNKDSAAYTEQIINTIKQMLEEDRFEGNKVVSCVSNSDLQIKSLRVDTTATEEIEKSLREEAAGRFGLNPETDEIRYMIAGSVRQGEEVKNELIVFAVNGDALRRHIEMLQKAGLEPVGIDAIPCALFRSVNHTFRRKEDKDMSCVLLDIGSRHTTVLIGKDEEILFAKQIPIAGEHINAKIASRLGITPEEAIMLRLQLRKPETDETMDTATRQAIIDSMHSVIDELAREVSLCFRYYAVTFRGKRPGKAIFAGGEAYEGTLLNALKRHLGVDIEVTEPLRGFDLSRVGFPDDKRGQLCEWTVAVGLGMKGIKALAGHGNERH